jgi:hypothetical protein
MTPGPEDLLSQSEKLDVMRNDQTVREQRQQQQQREASTFLDQYYSPVGGRFSVTENESVTGRVSPKPPPLPSTSPWSGAQPEPGIEPPIGYAIHQVEPLEPPSPAPSAAPATGGDAMSDAPSADAAVASAGSSNVERSASPPPSSLDDGGFDDAA